MGERANKIQEKLEKEKKDAYLKNQKEANPDYVKKNMSDDDILADIKKREEKGEDAGSGARGQSRDNFGSEIFGTLSDLGNLAVGNMQFSSQSGFIDEKETYHQRTCFVAGTLVTVELNTLGAI